MARYGYYGGWAPYVPVAERRRQAAKKVAALQKKGRTISPVHIEGRVIARTFWGKAWCDNLEQYSDYSNRLPRGRTYARNGSVVDLQIAAGEVTALVSGSSIYEVTVKITDVEKARWKALLEHCAGRIDSLVELLQGRFSSAVMEVITCRERGLFPSPKEIRMSCSCPDAAVMCKHVAAVLYGVGARLDESPEMLFRLRNVDHNELVAAASAAGVATAGAGKRSGRVLKSGDLSGLFGIELEPEADAVEKLADKTRAKKAATAQKKRPSR